MDFDFLILIVCALSAIAFLRLRPSLLIIGFNLAVTMRSLSTIVEFGQPTRQNYLPPSIYSTENLGIASRIFLIATILLGAGVLAPARQRIISTFPALPRWLTYALVAYFAAVIVSTRTILTHEYADPERVVFNFNLSGIHALLVGLVLYEMHARVAARNISPVTGLLLLFLLFLGTDYLKGGTGFPTGAMIGALLMFLRFQPGMARRYTILISAIIGLAVLAVVVRGVRVAIHADAQQALQTLADSLVQGEEDRGKNAEGAESIANGSQYAAHVLECISLYEAGVRREWRSIYSPIEYTLKPSFVVSALHWQRSEEAAKELSLYYVHGGGIFILGELYWNGGYICVLIVFAAIIAFAYFCDTRSAYNFFWCLSCCCFDVGLLQGVGYGFAQIARGGLNAVVAYPVLLLICRPPRAAQPPKPSPSVTRSLATRASS